MAVSIEPLVHVTKELLKLISICESGKEGKLNHEWRF